MKTALILFLAILCEVIATTALKFSDGFTRIAPSVIVVIGLWRLVLPAFHQPEGASDWPGVCDLVGRWDRIDCHRGYPHLARIPRLGACNRNYLHYPGHSNYQLVLQNNSALIINNYTR